MQPLSRLLHRSFALSLVLFATSALAQDDRIRLQTDGDAPYVRKDSDTVAIREGSPQSGTDGRHEEAPGVATDGEALGMLVAINDHAIRSAELARRKGVSAPVLAYARDLEREHGANQSKTRFIAGQAGINPYESDDVQQVRQRANAELSLLRGLDGAAFEEAFVEAMVQLNRDAVSVVDDVLLPASDNATVQGHLRKARERFAGNLDRAVLLDSSSRAAR